MAKVEDCIKFAIPKVKGDLIFGGGPDKSFASVNINDNQAWAYTERDNGMVFLVRYGVSIYITKEVFEKNFDI